MSVEKLILGTAGLGGLPYGRNQRVVSESEATEIFQEAYRQGIHTFDTSPSYSHAEEWLGRALDDRWSATVFSKNSGDRDVAIESLALLTHAAEVKFLYHNWKGDVLPGWMVGVSLYDWNDAVNFDHDVVQVPWNILSQTEYHRKSKSKIIARSVFLQGVLSDGIIPVPELREPLERVKAFAAAIDEPVKDLALMAALENAQHDYVLIGPTTMEELHDCIRIASRPALNINGLLPIMDCGKATFTDPRTWRDVPYDNNPLSGIAW